MDKDTVIKIADLAKIEINDKKIEEISSSLQKILNLVNEMNAINTDDVEPMSHPLNLKQELIKCQKDFLGVEELNNFINSEEYGLLLISPIGINYFS